MSLDIFKNEPNIETYSAGDVIFNEGDPGDVMFAVRSGTVHIIHNDDVLNIINAGDIFGEMALVDNNPRSAKAIAHTDAEIVRIDEERFKRLVHNTPFFALSVLRITVERLRDTMKKYGSAE